MKPEMSQTFRVVEPSVKLWGAWVSKRARASVIRAVLVLQNGEDVFAAIEQEVVEAQVGVQGVAEDHVEVEGSRIVLISRSSRRRAVAISSSPDLWGSASSRIGKSRPKSMATTWRW